MKLAAMIGVAVFLAASATAASGGPRINRLNVGDATLAYVERGRGEPLILVHGGMQDYRLWQVHMAALSRHYRVIAYSRRNHYPNAISADGWPDTAADLHGEDLARLLDGLHLGKVRIVAHSSGAHTALFFAAAHPERVVALALNEPPASGLLGDSPEGAAVARDFNLRLGPSREAFRMHDLASGVRLFADVVSGPNTLEGRTPAVRVMMMDNAVAHQADALSTRPRPVFTCEMARRITAPTLITNGDRSPAFFHAIADQLARCLPNSERASFDASHTVPLEAQPAYDEAVVAFFRRH
jgi:pimeloyl-ACP methyl ester carboxylesterase